MIVAGEGATFNDLPHFASGIVPGDGIFTTWSYRAGVGRAEAFLLNTEPMTARAAYDWGAVEEIVLNGKALSRARAWDGGLLSYTPLREVIDVSPVNDN